MSRMTRTVYSSVVESAGSGRLLWYVFEVLVGVLLVGQNWVCTQVASDRMVLV